MQCSVRCHAIITPDGIHKNSVITYQSTAHPTHGHPYVLSKHDCSHAHPTREHPQALPRHGQRLTLTATGIDIRPFTGEIHSTIDYNGIAVVGDIDLTEITLIPETLSSTVRTISQHLHLNPTTITFLPL